MRTLNMLQLVGGVAVAGVVAAGSTALTGSGVTASAGAADKWVGGTITQNITGGANIDSIGYTYFDTATQTKVASIAIAVTGAASKYLSLKPSGGTGLSGADEWSCTGGTGTSTWTVGTGVVKVQLSGTSPSTLTCSTATASPSHIASGYYDGLSAVDVTLAAS